MALEIHTVSVNVAALNNKTVPLFKVPTAMGGITVIGSNMTNVAAGTLQFQLVELNAGGTTILGTVASYGSVYVALTPQAGTITTANFIDGGNWVGLKEANAGTGGAQCICDIEYVYGK